MYKKKEVFTGEEIETALAEYIEIFEKHMPSEESWEYLYVA